MWSRRGISGVPADPQARRAPLALTLWTCGLALALPTGLGARGQAVPLSNPQELCPRGVVVRPGPVAGDRPADAGILLRQGAHLEFPPGDGRDYQPERPGNSKLAALSRVLRATHSVYVIKVIAVPQAAIGSARTDASSSSRRLRSNCSMSMSYRPWLRNEIWAPGRLAGI